MSGINKVTLIGNLGDEPMCTTTANGQVMARIRLATSERWRDKQTGERKESTEWHRLVFFGPVAETAQQYLRKGAKIYIEGKLRTRKWQDDSGQDKYSAEVVVSFPDGKMLMLDRNGGGTQQQGGYSKPQQSAQQPEQNAPAPATTAPQSSNTAPFNDSLDDLDAPLF